MKDDPRRSARARPRLFRTAEYENDDEDEDVKLAIPQ